MGFRGDCLSLEEGAGLLLQAYGLGINFWDTSEDYGTQIHIAHALRKLPRDQVVISSKVNLPVKPVDAMLDELEIKCLDILLIHDVELGEIDEAKATLESCQAEKALGRIRTLGISTHDLEVADLVGTWSEVEVLMLPINFSGYCLPDRPIKGGLTYMMQAAEKAWRSGKGIVGMKVMGWGTLTNDPQAAISFVAGLGYVHSLCIGMRSTTEIMQNSRLVNLG
jgi:predicted aldo/keto reductase-like oxidoreductase